MNHRTMAELEAGFDEILVSPKDSGRIEMIVRRPRVSVRETIQSAELTLSDGLLGDSWKTRMNPDPDMQINIMNSRAVALLAQEKERWALAGDQFFVDLDLSDSNLPPGTRLAFGSAILEITAIPHNGCSKFSSRFGVEATRFVNSKRGKEFHLRGLNAKVIAPGTVRVGDIVSKV